MLVAISHTDGVSIMRIIKGDAAAEVEKWKGVHPGEYVSHYEIAEADIPPDRTFRGAWTSDGKTITHDMEKCRSIHRDRMRAARAPKLAALDVGYQRADEGSDASKKQEISAKKQELRDVTSLPAIDAATTPEALKAVWPACLTSTDS